MEKPWEARRERHRSQAQGGRGPRRPRRKAARDPAGRPRAAPQKTRRPPPPGERCPAIATSRADQRCRRRGHSHVCSGLPPPVFRVRFRPRVSERSDGCRPRGNSDTTRDPQHERGGFCPRESPAAPPTQADVSVQGHRPADREPQVTRPRAAPVRPTHRRGQDGVQRKTRSHGRAVTRSEGFCGVCSATQFLKTRVLHP